jgi:putative aldouronate transport system permease protein
VFKKKSSLSNPNLLLGHKQGFVAYMRGHAALYSMLLPGFLMFLIFNYFPMYGITMAFQDFKPSLGFFRSPFIGLKHFERLISDPYFPKLLRNTILLGVYSLFFGFPAPILLALLFNEIKHTTYKRVTQTISYMPHFLSTVIVVGILRDMATMNDGIINMVIQNLGGQKINFFSTASWFRTLYIGSGIWQGVGFSSIIYLAAISGVNPELYESAVIDGASRTKQAVYITLPSILPTIVILFIFSVGGVLGNDFQKILLMYTPATYSTSDVISTYVYRSGIEGASQSYSAAVGLFMSLVSLLLLSATNSLSRKVGETSLW